MRTAFRGEQHTLERGIILEGHGDDSGRGCAEWSSEYVAGAVSPSRDRDMLCDNGGVRDV